MEIDPTGMCELLVGLGERVEIVGVGDVAGEALRIHVRLKERPECGGCGGLVAVKGYDSPCLPVTLLSGLEGLGLGLVLVFPVDW